MNQRLNERLELLELARARVDESYQRLGISENAARDPIPALSLPFELQREIDRARGRLNVDPRELDIAIDRARRATGESPRWIQDGRMRTAIPAPSGARKLVRQQDPPTGMDDIEDRLRAAIHGVLQDRARSLSSVRGSPWLLASDSTSISKITKDIDHQDDFYITFGSVAPKLGSGLGSIARISRGSEFVAGLPANHPFREVITTGQRVLDSIRNLNDSIMPHVVRDASIPLDPYLIVAISIASGLFFAALSTVLRSVVAPSLTIRGSDILFVTSTGVVWGILSSIILCSRFGPRLIDRSKAMRRSRERKELDARWRASRDKRMALKGDLQWMLGHQALIPIGDILGRALQGVSLDPAASVCDHAPERMLGDSIHQYERAFTAFAWALDGHAAADLSPNAILATLGECRNTVLRDCFDAADEACASERHAELASLLARSRALREERERELQALERQASELRRTHEAHVYKERSDHVSECMAQFMDALRDLELLIEREGGSAMFERPRAISGPSAEVAARLIRVGTEPVPIPAWSNYLKQPLPEVPCLVPVELCRAISIPGSLSSDERASLALDFAMAILLDNPPGEVKIVIFDLTAESAALSPLCKLVQACPPISGAGATGVVTTLEEFESTLASIREEIQRRLNSILDRDTAVESISAPGRRAPDRWVVVVLSFPDFLSPNAVNALQALCAHERGGRAGFHVIWADNQSRGAIDDQRVAVASLRDAAASLELLDGRQARLTVAGTARQFSRESSEVWRDIAHHAADFRTLAERHHFRDQGFDDLLRAHQEGLARRSAEPDSALEIPFGFDVAGNPIVAVFGRGTSHHALVVGKSGSGKSRLLQILIAAAARLYPPSLLNLCVIDCKGSNDGLSPFVIGDRRLAHIEVAGLGADREFAAAALCRACEDMKAIYKRSQRERPGSSPTQRRLLIIDEYQVLFALEDHVAADARASINELARLGRSAGFHLLLCSQTTEGVAHIDRGTLGLITMRIGLRCGERDTEVLFNDPRLWRRIMCEQRQGLYQSGSDRAGGQPVEFMTAVMDSDRVIQELLAGEFGVDSVASPAVVFNGERLAEFDDLYCSLGQAAGDALTLGLEVGVDGAARIHWVADSRWNLMALSQPQSQVAERVMAAALLSTKTWIGGSRIIFASGARRPSPGTTLLRTALNSITHEPVNPRDIPAELESVQQELDRRNAVDPPETTPSIIVALHRLDAMDCFRGPSRYEPAAAMGTLERILSLGPPLGIHVIATAASWAEAARLLGPSESWFGHRASSRMPPEDAPLIDSPAVRTLKDDRCILSSVDRPGEPIRFIPCRFGFE
jgi:S-DNA-T family DNA segregation ATPase FtsK/SpoIIIE